MQRTRFFVMFLLFATSLTTLASIPNVRNAEVSIISAEKDLTKQFRNISRTKRGTFWIAYTVPAIDSLHIGCQRQADCFCYLDHEDRYFVSDEDEYSTPKNGNAQLDIYFRIESGKIANLRMFTSACGVDAKGAQIVMIENPDPDASARMLARYVLQNDDRHRHEALAALASHATALADDFLESIAVGDETLKLRKNAVFWIGNARGERGFEFLRNLYPSVINQELRQHMTFAFSVNDSPEAIPLLKRIALEDEHRKVRGQAIFWLGNRGGQEVIPFLVDIAWNEEDEHMIEQSIFSLSQTRSNQGNEELIRIARKHAEPHARSKALFWLGQKAGEKVIEILGEAIEKDPNLKVKEQAVFALSQLPNDEGIPPLLDLARNHKNPAIRKKALFWLGQHGGEEALSLFEEILEEP